MALATAGGAITFAAGPALITTAPVGNGAPAVASALTGSPAPAQAPAKDSTDSQIAAWTESEGDASASASDAPLPRTIHGEVGAGVGAGGYRDVYGVADIPVGRNSDLTVAASNTSGEVRGGRYGGGYGYGGSALALGFYSTGPFGATPACGRQPWGQAPASMSASPGVADCGGVSPP